MLNRRQFISSTAAALAAGCASTSPLDIPIIDTHTHFYDPTRPEGVSWPEKNDPILYRPVLPPEYIALAKPLGIIGTVVVEASPRVEDNDWILELARQHSFLLAHVGHLKPGTPDFVRDLERLSKNRRFAGIRAGGWNIALAPENSAFLRDLRSLAEKNLSLDVLGGPDQLPAVMRLARAIPTLRIVIDHCANLRIDGRAPDPKWTENVRAAARQPNVYMKISGLPENTGQVGAAPGETSFYKPVLDVLWTAFGEDRLIFGSNWPVSSRFAPVYRIVDIVRAYFLSQGRVATEKYFHKNARRVYRLA